MRLHEDTGCFPVFIADAARYFKTSQAAIRKDYYVTRFLKGISAAQPNIIFKGGTCLSKCHKVINRFSEDVDLSYENHGNHLTESMKRHLKTDVIRCASEVDLTCTNLETTRSRRDFNRYEFAYPGFQTAFGLKDSIIVETAVFQASFPTERKQANSLIGSYLFRQKREEEVERYALYPFEVTVQTIERTFIDKVFAICDYFEADQKLRNSRHIYDLYKLYPLISFDDDFRSLLNDVRAVRQVSPRCISAQEGYRIADTLAAIEQTDYYKSDYEQVTSFLLLEDVPYKEAVGVLGRIRDLEVF